MKALKLTLLAIAVTWGMMHCPSLRAQTFNYQVLQVPGQSPGAPWYADLSRNFIPTDGEWVSIVFWRAPESVPENFNLLNLIDLPRAFGAPLLLEGEEWWKDQPFVFGNLVRLKMWNAGLVPVYFVTLAELEAKIQDDVLTLGELENFASLRIGQASFVHYDTRSDFFANDGFGNNRGFFTASGTFEDGGQFNVRMFESPPDPETGLSPVDTVIAFTNSP